MKTVLPLLIVLLFHSQSNGQILIVDSLFGTNGIYTPAFPYNEDPSKSFIQPDGKIVVGGFSSGPSNEFYSALTRFDICGLPDLAFADSGLLLHSYDFRNIPYDILLQADEKIVCAGVGASSNAGSGQIPFISRYLSDGSIDTTFGVGGYKTQRFDPVSSGGFYSLHQYNDGRLLTIGRSNFNINGGSMGYGAVRFMEDGTLDPTFDGDGIARYPQPGFAPGEVRGELMDDGSIIVAFNNVANVSFTESIAVSALDSTGALDTSYGTAGIFLDTALTMGTVWIEKLPNGNTVVAAAVQNASAIDVLCLSPQGELVPSFGTGGRLRYNFPAAIGEVKGIRLIDNTQLMIFGRYYVGSGVGFLLSVNTNGTVNSPFGFSGFLEVNFYPGTHFVEDVQKLTNGQLLCVVNGGGDYLITRLIQVSNVPHITQNGVDLETTGGYFLQWYFNTLIIPGATASVYTPVMNGVYTVIATDSVGCSYQSDPFVLQNVGLSENANDNIDIIINNPVSDQLFIASTRDLILSFSIYNVQGKLLKTQEVNAKNYSEEMLLAKGNYVIRITTTEGIATRMISVM